MAAPGSEMAPGLVAIFQMFAGGPGNLVIRVRHDKRFILLLIDGEAMVSTARLIFLLSKLFSALYSLLTETMI